MTSSSSGSMLPTAQTFRRTTSSTRDGLKAASSLTAGSSSADGTSRAVSFSSPQVGSGSRNASFFSSPAASGTADGTGSSIGTASTAASSGMASTSTGGSSLPPPGSESKYRRGASSYSSSSGTGTSSANQAQHVPNGAAAPMTTHINNNSTTAAAATTADNRSVAGGSNRPTKATGAPARSGLQHYLSSVPTYRSLQQQTASMLRKKNGVWSGSNTAIATGTGASQAAVAPSSSFGSTGNGTVDYSQQSQQQHVVLPRLANLANSFHAGPHAHTSSASGGSGGGVGAPAPSRFYNPWRRRSVSSGGGARRGVRGGGGGGTMISPFGIQRGISGGGGTSRSRRRIVLPILVLLLIGWYAMGSGDGSGRGLNRRGRKKGISNLHHKNSNIRAATTISAARAEFEAGMPMPANGASTTSTAQAQTKKNSPMTTVALTHNATDLVGKRMKRQSGDDHDSSDEGVVVAKARR